MPIVNKLFQITYKATQKLESMTLHLQDERGTNSSQVIRMNTYGLGYKSLETASYIDLKSIEQLREMTS